jgi:hypothetical protein
MQRRSATIRVQTNRSARARDQTSLNTAVRIEKRTAAQTSSRHPAARITFVPILCNKLPGTAILSGRQSSDNVTTGGTFCRMFFALLQQRS